MGKLLWQPSEERKRGANITRFIDLVNKRYGEDFRSYNELYDWSIDKIPDFWASVVTHSRYFNQRDCHCTPPNSLDRVGVI
ncbi:MAG: hypothetical protein U9M91_04175 [Chloroflexota bacterium]|nr:hypothetical protein [Chloroflexota bacterium]